MKNLLKTACFSKAGTILIFLFLMQHASIAYSQQTLCQQIGENFVPQVVVGTDHTSVTTTAQLGSAGWSFQNIEINGLLIVNTGFSIQSCKLRMGRNATIQIEPNVLFQSVGSQYFRCGTNLWTGFVLNGGAGNFFFNHIEDASVAIEIKSSATNAVLLTNTFNRNNKGVRAQGIAVNALLAGNTFSCNRPLNGVTLRSYAGVELRNCSAATIGRTEAVPGYRNVFMEQDFGVVMSNSTASLGLSEFYNNRNSGVYARRSLLTVRGADQALRTDFVQNNADLKSDQSSLNVFYCYMDSCKTINISSIGNNNREQIHLYDNEIHVTNQPEPDNFKMAISLERSQNGNDLNFRNTIERNHISIHDFSFNDRRGMHVRGSASCQDYMRIDSNIIVVYKGGTSAHPTKFMDIDISGAGNFQITRNRILSENAFINGSSRWGIFLANGAGAPAPGNLLWNNTVTGHHSMDAGCCAFHAEHAGPWSICSNTTNDTYRGFHITGVCGPSAFGLNNIGNHNADPWSQYVAGAGLIMQGIGSDNAYLGDQICQGNLWDPGIYPFQNAYAAILLGKDQNNPSLLTIDRNEFLVDDITDQNQAPVDRLPTFNWFKETDCLQTPTGCVGTIEPELDAYDGQVRGQYPLPNPFPEVDEWENTRRVMFKLMRYPALNTGDATAFYAAYVQSSAGLYARFDSMMYAVSNAAASTQTSLFALESVLREKQAQIDALDAGISNYTQISPTLLLSRAVLLAEMTTLSQQRETLLEQCAATRDALLEGCAQYNQNLPASQPYEQNQRQINAIAIQLAKGNELTPADKAILHTIAGQCLQVAGQTRSYAAGLLPPEENGAYWQEDPAVHNCAERSSDREEKWSQKLDVSPNPASDFVRITFDHPASGEISVCDLTGRVLQTYSMQEAAMPLEIPTAQLSNGSYLLVFRDPTGRTLQSARFVVLH